MGFVAVQVPNLWSWTLKFDEVLKNPEIRSSAKLSGSFFVSAIQKQSPLIWLSALWCTLVVCLLSCYLVYFFLLQFLSNWWNDFACCWIYCCPRRCFVKVLKLLKNPGFLFTETASNPVFGIRSVCLCCRWFFWHTFLCDSLSMTGSRNPQ